MKTLVAYYSLQKHTEKVAKLIARYMRADLEIIKDTKYRDHLKSWQGGAFDEELRSSTKIHPIKYNTKDYDLVIMGTPIWDGITPPNNCLSKSKQIQKNCVLYYILSSRRRCHIPNGKTFKKTKSRS